MARRGNRRDRDDASAISSSPLRSKLLQQILEPVVRSTRSFLREIEDRREFSPELARPARAFRRFATKLEVGNANARKAHKFSPYTLNDVPHNVRFADPTRVAVCIRRHQRREVLHALKRVGSGSSVKRGRWSEFSDISCKRK